MCCEDDFNGFYCESKWTEWMRSNNVLSITLCVCNKRKNFIRFYVNNRAWSLHFVHINDFYPNIKTILKEILVFIEEGLDSCIWDFFFLNGWNVLTVIGVNNSAKWYWWTNSLREQNVQIKFRQKNQDSEQIIWKIKNKIKQRCFVVRLKIEYLITVKVKVPKILGTVPIFCVLQRDSVGIIFDLSTIHSTSISFSTREIYRLSTSKYKILRV